jgi:hypothetical protein
MTWRARVRRWLAPDVSDPVIDTLIKPPVPKYAGADEALSARTAARRAAAASLRQRAVAVESGVRVGQVLKMTRRS